MKRVLVFIFAVAVVIGSAYSGLAVVSDVSGEASPTSCREGDVMDGVHHPQRLKIIDRCVTARGTIAIIEDHQDGDWHMGMFPDLSDLDLLGRANLTKVGGLLIVEVIPKDQKTVKRPRVGSRVQVTGAYVIDTPYGWREIHPVWEIQEISASPIPEGTGQKIKDAGRSVRRILLRLRAELRERLD
jgi:hypothetical protein